MHLFNTILLLAGVVAAAPALTDRDDAAGPSGHEVEIKGLIYAGSGCPAGSAATQLSSDLTTLTVLYDSFIAQAGKGLSPSNYRKNCQLNVKLHYPQGWQFSILKADYRGVALIPKGATGTCKATYYFSGDSQQISRSLNIPGPYPVPPSVDGSYLKTDVLGVESTVWSPCGVEGLLNINSQVQVTPLDSNKDALMTVDSTDLKFKQICYLQWRKCKK